MSRTEISVNKGHIAHNKRAPQKLPVLVCNQEGREWHCNRVDIIGTDGSVVASVVYEPGVPSSPSGRAYVETHLETRSK